MAAAAGADLGLGRLIPLASRVPDHDALIRGVMTSWRGSEAWLALGAVAPCAASTPVYRRLPQALLPPILTILSAPILRGIAIEDHVRAIRSRPVRIDALAGGSIVAALFLGLIPGGWIQLALAREGRFGDGPLDGLPTLGIVCAAIVSGYLLFGAGFRFCARPAMSGTAVHSRGKPCEVRSGSHRARPGVVNGHPDHVRNLAPGE
jgi:cytochrome bd-type quinol oxidase subunit 2